MIHHHLKAIGWAALAVLSGTLTVGCSSESDQDHERPPAAQATTAGGSSTDDSTAPLTARDGRNFQACSVAGL